MLRSKKSDYLLLIRVTVELVEVELEVVVEVFLTRCACALATEKITPRVAKISRNELFFIRAHLIYQ